MVLVENLLHDLLRFSRDLVTTFIQHEIHFLAPDNFTDSRLGHLSDHVFLIAIVEHPVSRIFQPVLDRKLDIDDIFIVRQHQRLVELLVAKIVAIPDLDGTYLRNIDDFMALYWPWHTPVDTGLSEAAETAERHDHARLAFLY